MDKVVFYLMEKNLVSNEWWTCGGPYATELEAEAARVDLRGLTDREIEVHQMTIHNQKEVDSSEL